MPELKEKLLKELEDLECKEQYDYHPRIHKLIVDYIFEKYDLEEKCLKH